MCVWFEERSSSKNSILEALGMFNPQQAVI